MKNTIIATIMLTLFAVGAVAQETESSPSLGLMFGPSIPVGEFGETNGDEAGLAKTGLIIGLNFRMPITKEIGGMILLRSQANSVDVDYIADELSEELPVGSEGTVESTSWGMGMLMAGVSAQIPLSDKFFFTSKLLGGLVSATSPEMEVKISYAGESASTTMESTDGSAFGYMAGIGFLTKLGDNFGIGLDFEYFGTTPEFEDGDVVSVNTEGKTSIESSEGYDQSISTFNIGIGLNYFF